MVFRSRGPSHPLLVLLRSLCARILVLLMNEKHEREVTGGSEYLSAFVTAKSSVPTQVCLHTCPMSLRFWCKICQQARLSSTCLGSVIQLTQHVHFHCMILHELSGLYYPNSPGNPWEACGSTQTVHAAFFKEIKSTKVKTSSQEQRQVFIRL